MTERTLHDLLAILFQAHPWHGVSPGPDLPATLTAFIAVCAAMLTLRQREPAAERKFRTPLPWVTGLVGILGCAYLFYSLPHYTQIWFVTWNVAGLIVYFMYAAHSAHRTRSSVGG